MIQVAVARGFRVAASASKKNHPYMVSLGAEKTVDYHERDWQAQVIGWEPKGVDAAIAIHPGTARDSEAFVRTGGAIVAVSGDRFNPQRRIDLKQIPHEVDIKSETEDLLTRVAAHEIQLTIEKTYPFSEGLAALEKVKTRHNRGKLVLHL